MLSLRGLLERGYFPKELPNLFNTASFATAVTTSGVSLPSGFTHRARDKNPPIALSTRYSHARGGLHRRTLSLPNPIPHYHLCQEIMTNWDSLQPHIVGTSLSATNPVQSSTGRAIQSAQAQDARPELAIKTRLNNRYILQTDISRFYHSIYTHSSPWALYNKTIAKSNRGMKLLGNRLDYWVRNGQSGQTIGIPIGPDTSLLLSEILMQKCDQLILDKFPGVSGHRFIDDYEIGFHDRAQAEDAFHILEMILGKYELALNHKKTKIIELPYSYDAPWVAPLRSFSFRLSAKGQATDLRLFFNLAFELHNSYPDESVMQYAVAKLRNFKIGSNNWLLFQKLLLNCVVPEPATLPSVLRIIISKVNAGATPAIIHIEEVVNDLLINHAVIGHSSEVAWALYGCLTIGLTVSSMAVDKISQCDDSVVALLALHCEAEKKVEKSFNKDMWLGYMNGQSLYEEHWLLAYEANVKGWLPSQETGRDHVENDPNFCFLKSAGVSFYDTSMTGSEDSGVPLTTPKEY